MLDVFQQLRTFAILVLLVHPGRIDQLDGLYRSVEAEFEQGDLATNFQWMKRQKVVGCDFTFLRIMPKNLKDKKDVSRPRGLVTSGISGV